MLSIKRLIFLFCLLSIPCSTFGADIYITQATSGSDTGASCANAHSASWFNTNATGGNVYHLCGTFTGTAGQTILTIPASGTAGPGNDLKVLFETGAILAAPYWSLNGAIHINGKNYITIDGGSNGVIENTANGSGLTYQADTAGLLVEGNSSHIEIKNLTVTNMYVREISLASLDRAGGTSWGVQNTSSGTDISIHNNNVSWCSGAILSGGSGGTNFNIYSNTTRHMNWGIYITPSSDAAISNYNVYSNDISDWSGWECPGGGAAGICAAGVSPWDSGTTYSIDQRVTSGGLIWRSKVNSNYGNTPENGSYWQDMDVFHQDGIFIAGHHIISTTPINIYSNYIHGLTGGSPSASIFLTLQPYSYTLDDLPGPRVYVYNNIITPDPVRGGIGVIASGSGASNWFYNNTIEAGGSGASCFIFSSAGVKTLVNNICINAKLGIETWDSYMGGPQYTLGTVDYNIWYNSCQMGHCWSDINHMAWKDNLTDWRAVGFDVHGSVSDPVFVSASNYHLQATSPAIGTATSTVTPLTYTTDYAGVARGASWDIGAYEYSGASGQSISIGAGSQSIGIGGGSKTLSW